MRPTHPILGWTLSHLHVPANSQVCVNTRFHRCDVRKEHTHMDVEEHMVPHVQCMYSVFWYLIFAPHSFHMFMFSSYRAASKGRPQLHRSLAFSFFQRCIAPPLLMICMDTNMILTPCVTSASLSVSCEQPSVYAQGPPHCISPVFDFAHLHEYMRCYIVVLVHSGSSIRYLFKMCIISVDIFINSLWFSLLKISLDSVIEIPE